MLRSIKTIIFISFLVVGISLSLIIILGLWQVQLNKKYADISELSEKTLFSFVTLREQVTEGLISSDDQLLKNAIPEIEALNNSITRFFDSDLIPPEYKLALTNRVDLAGLVLDLRRVITQRGDLKAELKLHHDLRIVADNLFKIDRVITGQIRNSVVNFQLTIIGALGLLISGTSLVLILLYRKTIRPIFGLAQQLKKKDMTPGALTCSGEAALELHEITDSLNRVIAEQSEKDPGKAVISHNGENHEAVSKTINETTNQLNGIINYSQLLLESELELPGEQKNMLRKIMDSGEKIAEQWQKLSQRFSS